MDIKKFAAVGAAAAGITALIVSWTTSPGVFGTAWGIAQQTAFMAAGIRLPDTSAQSENSPLPKNAEPDTSSGGASGKIGFPRENADHSREAYSPSSEAAETDKPEAADIASQPAQPSEEAEPDIQQTARVISRNITEFDDGLDYAAAGEKSGVIYRKHYAGYSGDDYITLPGGGLLWNCTGDSPEKVTGAAGELPDISVELNSSEPQVLIVHTHTTESYEPYQRSYYDAKFPFRTRDSSRNMVRVGEVLAQRLAEHGISVLHDGTIHDYPAYTGAYDRSEATIRAALEEYPSIKVIIDLHRDAISNPDGSRTAPTAIINGRNAAQFMIISGCDDGRFGNMPDYLENLKLACLIQGSAEELYPGLARPILFDYRNYNQHISTGSLLIELGSHANSLDEAVYSAELLGDSISAALERIGNAE